MSILTGVEYHQYMSNKQLKIARLATNTFASLSKNGRACDMSLTGTGTFEGLMHIKFDWLRVYNQKNEDDGLEPARVWADVSGEAVDGKLTRLYWYVHVELSVDDVFVEGQGFVRK
jgi:hypothetical protein